MIRMSVPLHCFACSTGASGDQGVEGETGETGPTWKEWKDFQLLPRFEKMRGEPLSFAGGEVEDQGRGGGGGEESVEAAGGQGLLQTINEELSLC